MLLLVTRYSQKLGFFTARKAKKGKIQPVLKGMDLGGYPAVEIALVGNNQKAHHRHLAPYLERSDILIMARDLANLDRKSASLLEEYARRQCVNLARRQLQQAENHRKNQVVLVDKDGECAGEAGELMRVCTTVWVATRCPEKFISCGEYTLEHYGVQPLFVQERLPKVQMVIAPYGMEGWQYNGGKLFCPHEGIFPKKEQFYVPDYAHLPDFDPAVVTAGVFAAFHPKELMTALPNMQI